MYWPCGVPRVYAYNGQRQCDNADEEEGEGRADHEQDNQNGPEEGQPTKNHDAGSEATKELIGLCVAPSDHFSAIITSSSLAFWHNRPNVLLAITVRSASSVGKYGLNETVLLRADGGIAIVKTSNGFLLIYSIETDPLTRVYQQHFDISQTRRQSLVNNIAADNADGLREMIVRLKRAIKVDAGINAVVSLPNELVVATARPPAVQCLKWSAGDGLQTSAELLSKMDWLHKKSVIVGMIYSRAMHLAIWIADDGKAYAVQRQGHTASKAEYPVEPHESGKPVLGVPKLFDGHCFHDSQCGKYLATVAAVNARFSLLTVGCQNGELLVYEVKDYSGNISLSHRIGPIASLTTTGHLTCLAYSPDGYCLFVGFEKGWVTWSVFGKPGVSSFTSSGIQAESDQDGWLAGVSTASWTAGGAELLLTSPSDYRIWKLEFSRSAATGCFSPANFIHALMQKPSELVMYRGHNMPDLFSISGEASLWHHAQYPTAYLRNQGPIKYAVMSQDGRYAAIAGKRGLAHYSVQSGRWKTFLDRAEEDLFTIRGGMCWFHHVLIAATESDGSFELRAFSRDAALQQHSMFYQETLPASVVFLGPSGEDSLLVYTSENILYHFVISITSQAMSLVQVGQIAFHGVVRAPTRVRSVSWILPENQLRNGDPSQDVTMASVLFLVDDKMVLLQPSRSEDGSLRYDLRVLAQHIEFYVLMRDQLFFNPAGMADESVPPTPSSAHYLSDLPPHQPLIDSLWAFSGSNLRMWSDVRQVLRLALEGSHTKTDSSLWIPVDFYPLSILLNKGVVLGVEAELVQRRDLPFAQFRLSNRTHLFIPYLLQHYLSLEPDSRAALVTAHRYEHLPYFAHALEVFLHNVLDLEANSRTQASEDTPSFLPVVLSFLYTSLSESSYLSTVVQCIRKTDISHWPLVLAHLPPPATLFEQAIQLDDLKTATGCLIVLQSFREDLAHEGYGEEETEGYVTRLLVLARDKGEWELCSELAQFLMALDPMGDALRRVVEAAGFVKDERPADRSPKRLTGLGLTMSEQSTDIMEGGRQSNYSR